MLCRSKDVPSADTSRVHLVGWGEGRGPLVRQVDSEHPQESRLCGSKSIAVKGPSEWAALGQDRAPPSSSAGQGGRGRGTAPLTPRQPGPLAEAP